MLNTNSTPAQSLSLAGEGSAPGTPMDSSFGGSGAEEDYDIDEDSNMIEDDDEYKVEAVESMPERIPKIKRYVHITVMLSVISCSA